MKKWIIPVAIVAAGAAGFAVYQKQHADRQPENIIASNGRLELERIDVATLYAGRVKSMNVDEGSEVKAGDVLAELSSDTTSGRVEEAQAGELAAKEMVQRAQAGVKQAQEAVARADAQIAAQLQQQKLAQMELDNAGKMQSEDLVSPAETQRRRSQRDGAAAAVKAARKPWRRCGRRRRKWRKRKRAWLRGRHSLNWRSLPTTICKLPARKMAWWNTKSRKWAMWWARVARW